MIDVGGFNVHHPNHKPRNMYAESRAGCGYNADEWSEDNYLICDREIFGFSLTDKRWCAFNLDLIQDVEYSNSAFNALLLPVQQKSTILSLVEVHTNVHLQFGDVVQDKGKGMIFLLHGEPGTGKTLTAGESSLGVIPYHRTHWLKKAYPTTSKGHYTPYVVAILESAPSLSKQA